MSRVLRIHRVRRRVTEAQNLVPRPQFLQRLLQEPRAHSEALREPRRGDCAARARPAQDEFGQRAASALGASDSRGSGIRGHASGPVRNLDAENAPEADGVGRIRPQLTTRDPQGHRPASLHERVEEAPRRTDRRLGRPSGARPDGACRTDRRLGSSRLAARARGTPGDSRRGRRAARVRVIALAVGPCQSLRHLRGRQRPELAQQVGDPLGVGAHPPSRSEPLQFGLHLRQDRLVEQVGRAVVSEQRRNGIRVQGQQVGATLGMGQILLVEQGGRIPEEKRVGEGGGLRDARLDNAHRPRGDPLHEGGEGRHVVDILEAFARRLHQHGEVAELTGGLQELTGLDALEPQGRAPPGGRPRHEQGAGGAFAEAGGEQGRLIDPGAHEPGQFLGIEDDELSAAGQAVPSAFGRGGRRGKLEDDPVIGHDDLRGQAQPLLHALAYRHGPRLVDAPPVGAVEDEPLTAGLVLVALQHQGGVTGDDAGDGSLLVQQSDEIGPGALVEAGGGQALQEGGCRAGTGGRSAGPRRPRLRQLRSDLAQEGAPCGPGGGGASGSVALPEGQAGAAAGGGIHDDAVGADLTHPPARGAQGDDVADGGLVDHLLVELAHAPPSGTSLALRQDDGEGAAVGDGPRGGDGRALSAGAGGQRARPAVPCQARSEVGQVRGGEAAGEQLQDRVEGGPRQPPVGSGTAHRGVPGVGVQVVDACRRHGLLGEDVQGIGDQRGGLDGAGAHALGGDGGVDELGALDRVDGPARTPADAVLGPPHALQAGGDRGRRRDLEDEVDGAHVDAELEGGGGDHAAQLPGFQLAFDGQALLLGDGAVVGLGDDRGLVRKPLSALGLPHLPGLVVAGGLGRDGGGDAPVAVDDESGRAHGVGLVEVGGQPLAGAAGVDEDECGAVGEHLVEDRVLDVRPDRGGHLAAPAAAQGTGRPGGPSLPRHRLPQGAVGTPGLRMIAPPGTAGASPITSVVSAE